jgi:phosphatidylglycerol lysyltransferase
MADTRRARWKALLGIAVSLIIAGLAVSVLYRTFQQISPADVLRSMQAVPIRRLLAAALCVGALFTILPVFEVIVVRYVNGYRGKTLPMVTALIAYPLGHAVGQALLSGGAIRYRMYRPAGFSAVDVGASILMCALPPALAFGWLMDLALVIGAERLAPLFHVPSRWLVMAGAVGLLKDAGYLLLVKLRKAPIRLGGWAVRLPTPRMTSIQLLVGTVDMLLLASVLYLLMPSSMTLAFLPFLGVYLASVLAGILSHVPAGFGVLESVLLLLLPDVPAEELLAAVLLYRVLYEVIPFLLALALWIAWELFSHSGARARFFAKANDADAGHTGTE